MSSSNISSIASTSQSSKTNNYPPPDRVYYESTEINLGTALYLVSVNLVKKFIAEGQIATTRMVVDAMINYSCVCRDILLTKVICSDKSTDNETATCSENEDSIAQNKTRLETLLVELNAYNDILESILSTYKYDGQRISIDVRYNQIKTSMMVSPMTISLINNNFVLQNLLLNNGIDFDQEFAHIDIYNKPADVIFFLWYYRKSDPINMDKILFYLLNNNPHASFTAENYMMIDQMVQLYVKQLKDETSTALIVNEDGNSVNEDEKNSGILRQQVWRLFISQNQIELVQILLKNGITLYQIYEGDDDWPTSAMEHIIEIGSPDMISLWLDIIHQHNPEFNAKHLSSHALSILKERLDEATINSDKCQNMTTDEKLKYHVKLSEVYDRLTM